MEKCKFLNESIIAHRGIYNNITIYENTLESIMYAVNNKLSVFIDVRVLKDNELVLYHDKDASRLNKLKDNIDTVSISELNYISSFNIPTLESVLNSVNGLVPIIINILDDNKIIRNKLIELLIKYNGYVLIVSENYDVLKFYKKKKYDVGLMIKQNNLSILKKQPNVDALLLEYNLLDKIEINYLKEFYYLIGYVVDNRKDAATYIKIYNNLVIDNIEEVFK